MRRILVLLGLCTFSLAPAVASPALISKATILRATANTHGKVIQALPTNAQIDVQNCGKSWCFISAADKFGYVPASVVASLPEGQPAPAYAPGPVVVAPPYYGPYPYPYYGYGYGFGYGYGGWGHRRW
jgi:hypothetical protein